MAAGPDHDGAGALARYAGSAKSARPRSHLRTGPCDGRSGDDPDRWRMVAGSRRSTKVRHRRRLLTGRGKRSIAVRRPTLPGLKLFILSWSVGVIACASHSTDQGIFRWAIRAA